LNSYAALRITLFILASVFFLVISWRPLRNPRSHGFYRFFVFEGILALLLLNGPFWFEEPLALRQWLSTALLLASFYCVVRGVTRLRARGGHRNREASPENYVFENTAHLVTDGIYRHIRHPMYGSLLLLAWGITLKRLSLPSLAVVLVTSAFLMAAVRMEERENVAFFGRRYAEYMQGTKRFIPFVF
jgi:protein-S-isoprenylcysteine O-methyltransferase Ste14